MAIAEFSKFAVVLNAALSQHHLLGFKIAQMEFQWSYFQILTVLHSICQQIWKAQQWP